MCLDPKCVYASPNSIYTAINIFINSRNSLNLELMARILLD